MRPVRFTVLLTAITGCTVSDGTHEEPASTGSTGNTSTGAAEVGRTTAGNTEGLASATLGVSATTDTVTGSDTSASSTGGETDADGATTGTQEFDCALVPEGPFLAEAILERVPVQTSQEGGAEDLAFDGQGHLGIRGQLGAYLRVAGDGAYEQIATDSARTYGLRFRADGTIVAAAYQDQQILQVSPDGTVSVLADGVGGVNGLFPDSAGGIWYTNFQEVGYVDARGNDQTVIVAASGANGIFYDDRQDAIYYSSYTTGRLYRAAVANGHVDTPVEIARIQGSPDGITLDWCGNLYIVDQANADLYRVWLDEEGEPTSEAELVVEAGFPTNVANAQFGVGEGWEAQSLYVAGVGGTVYRVDVGVPGAPYVTVR